jgi:hypothetical protein
VLLEITTHRIDLDAGIFALDRRPGRVEHTGIHIERDEPTQGSAVAQGVQ